MPFSSRALFGVTLFLWALGPGPATAQLGLRPANGQEEETATVVANGRRVSLEYTLTLADGTVAYTNVGGEAKIYVQGTSQMLPALEYGLLAMKLGDSKHISLTAAEGYGEVDESLFKRVPASVVPEDRRRVGAEVVATLPSGERRLARVYKVMGEQIVLDLNHPLAGQALNFDVKILAIE